MKKSFVQIVVTLAALAGLFAHSAAGASTFEGRLKMQMQSGKNESTVLSYAMKGQRLRMEIPAGEQQMVGLLDWDKREMSMLMPGQQMYMVIELKDVPLMDEAQRAQETSTLEKTSETATIVGREATKYIARDGKNVTELWLTTGLGSWFSMSGGSPMKPKKLSDWEKEVIAKGLFPLRMVAYDKKGKPNVHMEVVELTPQKLDDSLFVPPPGYSRFSMGGLLKGLSGAGK
ncbi:MAG TPA: DUF4412 domain-containing protein [Opitutus sp.]|nr:DUF4412 domain-containing protein [Opitutus sp.]